MKPVPQCDLQWIVDDFARHEDAELFVLDPKKMIVEVTAFAAMAEIAAAKAPQCAIPWRDVLDIDGRFPTNPFAEALERINNMPTELLDLVCKRLLDDHRRRARASVDDAGQRTLKEALRAFVVDPTEARALTEPLRSAFPRLHHQWLSIQAAYRIHAARATADANPTPLVIRQDVACPPGSEALVPHRLELWVHVSAAVDYQPNSPDILALNASLIHVDAAHRGELVAAAYGYFVGTHRSRGAIASGDLFDIFDAHSSLLCDVWGDVHGSVLPSLGLRSLGALARRHGSTPGLGMYVPSVFVADRFRGTPLPLLLFHALTDACASAKDETAELLTAERSVAPAANAAINVSAGTVANRLRNNPIRLVLPTGDTRVLIDCPPLPASYNPGTDDRPPFVMCYPYEGTAADADKNGWTLAEPRHHAPAPGCVH